MNGDLASALVAAQQELPCSLGKDADGQIGQRSYRYLTLDKLIEQTRPILSKHGLAIVQHPVSAPSLAKAKWWLRQQHEDVPLHYDPQDSGVIFVYCLDKYVEQLATYDEETKTWT